MIEYSWNCLVVQMDFQNTYSILGLSRLVDNLLFLTAGKERRFGSWEGNLVGLAEEETVKLSVALEELR